MKKRAFTLAEMMVVMLILTIILAAFAPLMTKRRTVDISTAWRFATNNSDIYYGMGSSQTAMIGQNSKASDENARLIINTSDSNQRHAIFKQAGSKVGELWVNGDNFLLGNGFSSSLTGNYNTAIGYGALSSNTTGNSNVAIGYAALNANTQGIENTAIGRVTLPVNTTGKQNTALGYSALYRNTTGNYNTATGLAALYHNQTGNYNTANGYMALAMTSGNYNTAFGSNSLEGNTNASDNTAVGYAALRFSNANYNTAVGSNALWANSSGHSNTAVGISALNLNSTGSNNVALGGGSMPANTTGGFNTAVGYNALRDNTTGTNNSAIGYGALASNLTGNTNSALGTLACYNVKGSNKTCIGYNSGPTGIDSSTTNVVYLGSSSTTGIISGVSAISVYSDKRLKNVKEEYKNGLEQIRNIVPKYFTYKKDEDKVLRVGVVAQEVQKVLPDAVEKNGDGYLIVKQERIQYALLNAVKQLDKIIQNLITEVKTIVAKLNYHDEKIKKLEQENAELKARLEKLEKATF